MGRVESRLAELGLVLPPPLVLPGNNRTSAVLMGDALYLSGHGAAMLEDESLKRHGKLGAGVTEAEGYAVARAIALKMVATIRDHIGDLDRVRQVVKVVGYVNSAPDFERQSQVIHGASDLLHEVFGADIGRHARTSVGVTGLVRGHTVEIEGVFWIHSNA
jgi:enamine deaminase RidA (YjgF/YER057c/UK114 family)